MTDFQEAYKIVDERIERCYGITSTITDVLDPNTGDFNGSWVKVDYTLDAELALFVLLHLFGHTIQWNICEEFRRLGQENVAKPSAEELKKIYVYEKQATQYAVQLLHECGITDLDRWLSDWWGADWKWLEHFYRMREKLEQREVKAWIRPGEAELLTPLPIPAFEARCFVSRWAF